MPKISVIVPLKNDKRIFDLIKALENQTMKDFELIIGDGSDQKMGINTTITLKHLYSPNTTIAERLNEMAKHSSSDMIAITESDCIPGPTWLEDLLSEYVDDNTIVMGAQVELYVSDYFSYGNTLVPKKLFSIPHDSSLTLADDTEWFYQLQKQGVRAKRIFKAVNYHYKDAVKRQRRLPYYSREWAYTYLKYGDTRRWIRSTGFYALTAFFSFVTAMLMVIFGIYYKMKFKFSNKREDDHGKA